ncbi:MAG: hypothetical protein ACKOXC_07505 [Aquirufa sp.]
MRHSIRLITSCFVLFASTQLNAQQTVLIKQDSTKKMQTLFQGKIKSFGFSAAPSFQFGAMGPQAGFAMALHLNNKWEIGTAFSSTLRKDRDGLATSPQLDQKFSALSIAYTAKANSLIHLSFPLLIGAITSNNRDMSLALPDPSTQPNPMLGGRDGMRDGDRFWGGPKSLGIQPGVQLELNVLKQVRLFGAANYRFAFGENSTSEMQGFVGSVGVKVGLFDHTWKKKK